MAAKPKRKILVVDDETSVLFTYRMILEEQGYSVQTALTSAEALSCVRHTCFDIVLCDLSLEQNRTGFEVFDRVHEQNANTPCVLLTGYANEEAIERAEKAGIAVLFKPIDVTDLLKTIQDALRKLPCPQK
jgi:CheY-like chemotaxis protein